MLDIFGSMIRKKSPSIIQNIIEMADTCQYSLIVESPNHRFSQLGKRDAFSHPSKNKGDIDQPLQFFQLFANQTN